MNLGREVSMVHILSPSENAENAGISYATIPKKELRKVTGNIQLMLYRASRKSPWTKPAQLLEMRGLVNKTIMTYRKHNQKGAVRIKQLIDIQRTF